MKEKETDAEMLARLMADGFGEMRNGFKEVNTRLDVVDVRLDEMSGQLTVLEKGQTEIRQRLESIDKKQVGMLESLDETVHQSDFRKLVQRVEVLEIQKVGE